MLYGGHLPSERRHPLPGSQRTLLRLTYSKNPLPKREAEAASHRPRNDGETADPPARAVPQQRPDNYCQLLAQ